MQLSARGAQRTKDESKKLQMYSKQWLPGDTLRVFYPIYWEDGKPEIAVGAVWGHNVSDIKKLGLKTAFIPSTTQFDENAMPIGQPDITYQFSQIARVFVNGMKAAEEQVVAKKNWPTEAARKDALKSIEEKYDAKNNSKAVRPIIGKAMYYITTEVVSIKIVNGQPVQDSIAVSSAPLSSSVITKLYSILDDPKYAPEQGDTFVEIEWKYPAGTDKSECGRTASLNGLTGEYRLQTQFPDAYAAVASRFPTVATNCETIVRRATRAVDPAKVRQALTQYTFIESEYLDNVSDEDEETLLKHVDLIKELDATRALSNQDLITKINNALAEMEAQRVDAPVPNISSDSLASAVQQASTQAAPDLGVPKVPDLGAPTVPDLSAPTMPGQAPTATAPVMPDVQIPQPTASTPDINSLLNNAHNAGADDASIGEVDFSGTMI